MAEAEETTRPAAAPKRKRRKAALDARIAATGVAACAFFGMLVGMGLPDDPEQAQPAATTVAGPPFARRSRPAAAAAPPAPAVTAPLAPAAVAPAAPPVPVTVPPPPPPTSSGGS